MLADELRSKGIGLKSLSDGVDSTTTTGRLMFNLLATLAEFEREVIHERIAAGVAAARKRGTLIGRRRALNLAQIEQAHEWIGEGKSLKEIGSLLGCSHMSVYRALSRA